MEEIIVSLEPVFHRVERFLLWHNRYASLLAFALGHGLFYAIARTGLRPFCAVTMVLFVLHLLDCLKKKRADAAEKNLSELTQLVLNSYRRTWQTHEKLNTIKTENRRKYSLIVALVCLALAYIGVKINGFLVSYLVMLLLFTLPAVVYHRIVPKLLKRLAPLLEQLDQSMEYKRRTLIDRKDLLVKIKTPGLNENVDDDDDDDVRKLQQQKERKAPSDDEAAHIDELYANLGNGKHRIRIKGDEIKIKGYAGRQRSTLPNADIYHGELPAQSSLPEPDLTSFDFLNDYDDDQS